MIILLVTAISGLSGCPFYDRVYPPGAGTNALTQYSTLKALMVGIYDGDMTARDLRQYGDTGLGTFNALDGEMIVLDGCIYQVRYDGNVSLISPDAKIPYAAVSFYCPEKEISLPSGLSLAGLGQALDEQLTSRNLFCAFRIEGTFPYVRARAVPPQVKPYPPLAEVIPQQGIFEFENVEGTLVGQFVPAYVGVLDTPGYHFHFLSKDKTSGGHVLDLVTGDVHGSMDTLYTLTLLTPQNADFLNSDQESSSSEKETTGLGPL